MKEWEIWIGSLIILVEKKQERGQGEESKDYTENQQRWFINQ